MAAKGSCVSNVSYRGNTIGYKWAITSDGAGDADENGSADVEWFHKNIYGWLVGVGVEYGDADALYDLYIKDGQGIDILKGLGVNLAASASSAKNRFCPMNTGQNLGTDSYAAYPIFLWNADLECVGAQMGNAHKATIIIFVMRPGVRS